MPSTRSNMRLEKRTVSDCHAQAAPKDTSNQAANNNAPIRKRQRRLTAATQRPGIAGAKELKVEAIALSEPNLPVKQEEVVAQVVPQPVAEAVQPPREALPLEASSSSSSGSDSSSDSEPLWGSDSDSMDSSDSEPAPQGYKSAGPSIKVAPGKRIKWRNAIMEDDLVKQNLSMQFLKVGISCTAPATGSLKRQL